MAFDDYQELPNGGYSFKDTTTGETITLAPTPSVREHARKIDSQRIYAEAGQQAAEVAPVPAVSATSGSGRELPAEGAGGAPAKFNVNKPLMGQGDAIVRSIVGEQKPVKDRTVAEAIAAEEADAAARGGARVGGQGQYIAPGEPMPVAPPPPAAAAPPPPAAAAAPVATVPFHKPDAAPGAGGEGGGISPTGARALTARERYEASLRRGFGGSKATPEFEQNQHYQDTSTRGPADERIRAIEETETGPAPFEPGKYEAPRLDPKTLAGLVGLPTGEDAAAFDATLPPNANAEQAQKAWYDKLAGEVADGASIASLRARYGGGLPQGAPPKDPKKMAEWAKGIEAAEGRQGRVAEILDGKIREHRKGFDEAEGARAKQHAGKVSTFGPEGEAGERGHVARQEARRMEFEAEQAGIGGEHNRGALEREAEIQTQLADDLRKTNAEIARVNQEIESGVIDPDRWWNSKSTGEKIAAGIGILLAGFGGGGTLANHMGRMDKEIDRDIEAQKDSLNKKRGKATALQDVYKNLIAAGASDMAATEAMRKAAWVGVEGHIRQNAALSGSDLKMREADRAIAAGKKLQAERQAALSAGRRGGRTMAGAVIPARAATSGGRNLKLEAQEAERTAELEQKLGKGAAETAETWAKAVKQGGAPPVIELPGGVRMRVDPNLPPPVLSKMYTDSQMLNVGYADLQALKQRAKEPGGIVPGDPATEALGMSVASALSQLGGSGVPSKDEAARIISSTTPGPRRDAGFAALEKRFENATEALGKVGAKR